MGRWLDWWDAIVPVWLVVLALYFGLRGNHNQRVFVLTAGAALALTVVGALLIALLGVI